MAAIEVAGTTDVAYVQSSIDMKLKSLLLIFFVLPTASQAAPKPELWPDGTAMDSWFHEVPETVGNGDSKQYRLDSCGIVPDTALHTMDIQAVIDSAAANGGGVIVVTPGVFRTGALVFRPGTSLRLEEGAVLRGSDHIWDYPLCMTRIEGETCLYYGALINADGVDGFSISGEGTIDGNGEPFYRQFWLRRRWNPSCTNKDEQRPRLLYVSNSRNVRLEGVTFRNSPYWTTHFHNCDRLLVKDCRFESPCRKGEVRGPSTDAIDLDVVSNVHITGCSFCVNDDAIALKGGKGPYADAFMTDYPGVDIPSRSIGNGANVNVLVENCEYEFCHGCLTLGSESVYDRNIVVRRCRVTGNAYNLLWIKCRPDTPQHYCYIAVEDVSGRVDNMVNVYKWTQFYDLQGRKDLPVSIVDHIFLRRCSISCDKFMNVPEDGGVCTLSDFKFEDLVVNGHRQASR